MKPASAPLVVGLVAFALPFASHAAPVAWGAWTAVTDNTAIQVLGGYSTVEGVNLNGSNTTINNGTVDMSFIGIAQNASGSVAGITAGTSGFDFQSTGNNSNVTTAVGSPQTWAAVLDRVIGDFGAGDTATITLSGLTSGDSYYVQFFSSAPDANILSNSKITSGGVDSPFFGSHAGGGTKSIIATFTADGASQAFTISGSEPTYSALVIGVQPAGGDTTPPEWTATWPQADPLSATSITVRARTNENGNAYFVILPDGATAPSAAQIKAGTDSSGTPVPASGSLALTANAEATGSVGGLSPGTAYDVHFVAEDAVPNLQASPVPVDVSTLSPDTTPPEWIATWPQAEQLSATSITLRARTNENGTAYYVVLAGGAGAPSAAQVKAGNDSSNSPAIASGSLVLNANLEATGSVAGLAADTTYDVYFVAEDSAPNLQTTPSPVSVSLVTPVGVTWGSWTAVGDNTAIQVLGGYSTVEGVNLNGSNTTINNGAVDVSFVGIAQNASGSVAGITAGTSGFDFQSTGNNSNVTTAVGSPQTWATVLDRVIGDFGAGDTATITLSGLTPGDSYYVQFFSSAPDANILSNSKITSGGVDSPFFGSHGGGGTKSIIATFTANGTSQVFTISGAEPTYGALVIGVQPAGGPADPYTTWAGVNAPTGDPDDDYDGDGVSNAVEFVLGGDKDANDLGKLPSVGISGGDMTFTFVRDQSSIAATTMVTIELSTDLMNWDIPPSPYAVPDTATVGPPVAVVDNADGTDTVTLTVGQGLDTKKFARLRVDITP